MDFKGDRFTFLSVHRSLFVYYVSEQERERESQSEREREKEREREREMKRRKTDDEIREEMEKRRHNEYGERFFDTDSEISICDACLINLMRIEIDR